MDVESPDDAAGFLRLSLAQDGGVVQAGKPQLHKCNSDHVMRLVLETSSTREHSHSDGVA